MTISHSFPLHYMAAPPSSHNNSIDNQKNSAPPEDQGAYLYIIKKELSRRERIKKFIGGFAFFVFTLGFGIGLGLLFATLRQKIVKWYGECKTGIRKIKLIKRTLSFQDSESVQKINRLMGWQNKPFAILENVDFPQFIEKARNNLTSLSLIDLEKGLQKALKIHPNLNPDEKMTLLMVSEKVAQSYIKNLQFHKAYELRMLTAQVITPAPPLANFHLQLAQAHPKLGLRLQPLNTSLLKNQTLTIQKRIYDKTLPQLHISTKLSHPARTQIQPTLDRIQSHPKELLKALPAGFCSEIKVTAEDCIYQGCVSRGSRKWEGPFTTDGSYSFAIKGKNNSKDIQPLQVIDFKGVGKIKIGNDPNIRAEYNKIAIELESGVPDEKAAEKLNILFAALGLGAVSSSSRPEDIERIKVMQLYRAYYPKEAFSFEREAKSFEESVESLKDRIEAKVPDMKKKFQHYLVDHPELMYQQEVYPGQFAWSIKGLAKEAREAGACGLMAGVGNAGESVKDTIKQVISILKIGALSSQDRFQAGITAHGVSSAEDLRTGGGESVFTRMITQGMQNMIHFPFKGKMQLLYDLDLVERVGFAYSSDKFGTKEPTKYQDRPNIVNLAKELEAIPSVYMGNEVCIRNRIPPQFIRGIKVESEVDKAEMIAAMKLEGLATRDAAGNDCFNGIPLNKFIVVDQYFKAEYWN